MTPSSPSGMDRPPNPDFRIRQQLLRQVLDAGYSNSLAGYMLAVALCFMLRDTIPAMLWGSWLLLMSGVILARLAATRAYKRLEPNDALEHRPCCRLYVAMTYLTGLLWGLGIVLLFPHHSPSHQMGVIFIAAGLTAGAVPILAPLLRLYVVYMCAVLLPLAAIVLLQGSELYYWMAFLMLLYLMVLVHSARRMQESLVAALKSQFRNETLIERLKKSRERAEAANRAKNEFLANMSHEIRTPMNGVLGTLQLLKESPLDKAQQEFVDMAAGSAESLLALLNDILDFSRIEAGKLQLEQVQFDLRALVGELELLLVPHLKQKDIAFSIAVDPALPSRLVGDPLRLRQVLTNFLTNAIKFTERGEIKMRIRILHQEPDAFLLRFEVQDTGIGISQAKRRLLFNSFTQADSSMTRKYGGSGLGLAIVRQLIELMGGTYGVESEPDRGSCFWCEIRFDKAAPLAEPVAVAVARQETRQLHGRVLLVEDNPVNQKIAHGLLRKLGLEVELSGNGQEALERLASERFDAVLMDCQMPVLDGYSTSRELRAREQRSSLPRLPVIAMTAHAMPGDRQKCLDAGMDDYLAKPIRKEDLSSILVRWLPDGRNI